MSQNPTDESPDVDSVFPFIIISLTEDRGQTHLCQILIANIFEQGISPCKAGFPEIKVKRQIVDHYIRGICNLTQQYGIYTIELSTTRNFHGKYVIQTDDVDIEFSKTFTEYIKNIQHKNSQRANSIFTNDVFAKIYNYLSILEKTETENTSPVQTTRHTNVRKKIAAFSAFLNTIRESFSNNEISPNVKHDLQKILAWFIIDYFNHKLDLMAQARKNFRPQSTNDDNIIAEQSDYVWDPSIVSEHSNRHLNSSNKYKNYSKRLNKNNSTNNRCNTFKLYFIFT